MKSISSVTGCWQAGAAWSSWSFLALNRIGLALRPACTLRLGPSFRPSWSPCPRHVPWCTEPQYAHGNCIMPTSWCAGAHSGLACACAAHTHMSTFVDSEELILCNRCRLQHLSCTRQEVWWPMICGMWSMPSIQEAQKCQTVMPMLCKYGKWQAGRHFTRWSRREAGPSTSWTLSGLRQRGTGNRQSYSTMLRSGGQQESPPYSLFCRSMTILFLGCCGKICPTSPPMC